MFIRGPAFNSFFPIQTRRLLEIGVYKRAVFNPIHTWLFWLVLYRRGGGGGVGEGPLTPCNSFVFKVRQLKFCSEILSG